MAQIAFHTADLAPGELKSAQVDLSPFRFDRIRSPHDPLFENAFAALWAEFGAKDEMESRETLALRFARAPRMIYEMILVRRADEFVAVRDHSAIVAPAIGAVVHLSHNLVAPAARRTGLAGWLRTLPLQAARECLEAAGAPPDSPITLVAEMEHLSPDDPSREVRLRAYEKAGFAKIDPAIVRYHQPDFRPPAVIDATGGARPLPFQLLIRRVGREGETAIRGWEVRGLVKAIYEIYSPQFRPADLAHPLLSLDSFPPDDARVALLPPTRC
jgi:GNAT superfamily N-acetyltransferase